MTNSDTHRKMGYLPTAQELRGWAVSDMPDLSGQVAMVTGANSGLGYVTARELARAGAHVVMACRSKARGDTAKARLLGEVSTASVELRQVDLASLASIEEFSQKWDGGAIDLLVNNAGIALVPKTFTEDGFESHFGVNHVGTFAFTGRMMRFLLAAKLPRVVTVMSEGQQYVRLDMDNLNAEKSYHAALTYWRSKQANVYFAVQLQRWAVVRGLALRSVFACPGGVSVTNVLTGGANATRGGVWRAGMGLVNRLMAKPTIEGAWALLYAATRPDLPGASYVSPKGRLEFFGQPAVRSAGKAAYDTVTARRLWDYSQDVTGIVF